jgi:hypothetical protein
MADQFNSLPLIVADGMSLSMSLKGDCVRLAMGARVGPINYMDLTREQLIELRDQITKEIELMR